MDAIRVLMVEDSRDDAELLTRELRRGGFEPTVRRVDAEEDLRAAVRAEDWDVAICDWTLPALSAPQAIQLLKREEFEGPVIIVSGTMGEEHVVEAMRSGADDYLVKGNLRRLSPAIRRELREAAARTSARRAEGRLAVSEARLRSLVETIPATTYVAIASGESATGYRTEYISPQITVMLGYTPEELVEQPDLWFEILHPEDREAAILADQVHFTTGAPLRQEYRVIARDGRVVWIHDLAAMIPGERGHPGFSQGVLSDITPLKETEAELRQTIELLRASDEERRKLVSRLVTAREEEAQRIAGDIHDDPIQALVAVSMRLDLLRMERDERKRADALAQVEDMVDDTMRRLRRMLFELSPRTLATGGLGDALREYIHNANLEEATTYHLDDRLTVDIGQEKRTIAYRVVLEALSNVRKHAHAGSATVTIEDRDGGVHCTVTDDGRGIGPKELGVSFPGHLGTVSMRQRVEVAGGWIKLQSTPGEGTTVEFWLPGE